ncbi:MAG: hypothetical protein JXB15_05940 [Anaerolineales bacterium]|nr:hypothetical protein [Anaerolineales bacterium]
MNPEYILSLSDPRADLAAVGGKGASLARLKTAGLPVPDGFHITTAAYQRFVDQNQLQQAILQALDGVKQADPASLETASRAVQALFEQGQMPPDVAGAIVNSYANLPGINPAVAVRSSATAEDLPDLSFAGQQETYLNIQGAAALLEAVKRCWASLWTPRAIGYRLQHQVDQGSVRIAVVVQLLVLAEAAGILFTANPINGLRDQAVISAAWGLGEAVVGGLVTPDTLVIDKTNQQILEKQIADKQVMTVRVNGSTREEPVPEALRSLPVLDDERALELARLGAAIENLYGLPMDIEWALADGHYAILQARPITALPEVELPTPTEWPIPNSQAYYARGSLAEHLPNPVSTLFGTLGIRLANQATQELMEDFLKNKKIIYEFKLINGYFYAATRLTAREAWIYLKMSFSQIGSILRGGKERWQQAALLLKDIIRKWELIDLASLTPSELQEGACQLFLQSARFYTVIQAGTLPSATSSEMLFKFYYNKYIRREGDPKAEAFLFGFDTTPLQAEKALFDLADWCRTDSLLSDYLLSTPSNRLALDLSHPEPPGDLHLSNWQDWRQRFQDYLFTWGGGIYNFDFVNPLPFEAPEVLLEALKIYLDGKGSDPYARQKAAIELRESAAQNILSRLRWPKCNLFIKLLKWAQDWASVRENSLADMGLAHPQIRRLLGELGRRLAEAGAIREGGDIYWLEEQEVEAQALALQQGKSPDDFAARVTQRKAEWKANRRAIPPMVLPKDHRLAKLMPWSEQHQGDQLMLKGYGASGGKVTARACVLLGSDDFHLMQPGDVLVATTTTPAWTPLFTLASAVVTDIGGPLSHSSIVAREYGIPAVMACGVATRRIQTGQMITVDGSAGTVTIG